jgi:hypothetical protein
VSRFSWLAKEVMTGLWQGIGSIVVKVEIVGIMTTISYGNNTNLLMVNIW